jgi:hypothetical protein
MRLDRACRAAGQCLIAITVLMAGAGDARTQYPLAPSPVLDRALVSGGALLTGYLSVRETLRRDSSTFAVNRARLTVQILPADFVALRIQSDLAAIGRASGDTVPGFALTDAYAQLGPPNQSRAAFLPTLILGQFRTPFSLEYLTPFSLLQTANRSQVVDRVATRRDIGVMMQFAFGRFATLAGSLVNGEGPNTIRNANGKQLAAGRLTLFPISAVALGGKWAGEGSDHRWGFDARWMTRGLIVEGERIERRGPLGTSSTTQRAAGHYLLASYRVGRHVQPVVKWEQLRDRRTDASGATVETRLTWTTYGFNLVSARHNVRFQTNWIVKAERPVDVSNELIAQLIVIF